MAAKGPAFKAGKRAFPKRRRTAEFASFRR